MTGRRYTNGHGEVDAYVKVASILGYKACVTVLNAYNDGQQDSIATGGCLGTQQEVLCELRVYVLPPI